MPEHNHARTTASAARAPLRLQASVSTGAPQTLASDENQKPTRVALLSDALRETQQRRGRQIEPRALLRRGRCERAAAPHAAGSIPRAITDLSSRSGVRVARGRPGP